MVNFRNGFQNKERSHEHSINFLGEFKMKCEICDSFPAHFDSDIRMIVCDECIREFEFHRVIAFYELEEC
jgi:hypothetical protein